MEMKDALRASDSEIGRMLMRSVVTWSSYAEEARENDELPFRCLDIRGMLGAVPAFLTSRTHEKLSPVQTEHEPSEHDESSYDLFISGKSTWCTTEGNCNLQAKTMSHRLLLGVSSSTPCHFAEDCRFRHWPGIEKTEPAVQSNCIAVLAFAWCYIFSAKWVELQRSDGMEQNSWEQLVYLHDVARWSVDQGESPDDIEVDLGTVDDCAARWWAAVLAAGEGWQATITRAGRLYRSPWSIRVEASRRFRLRKTPARSDGVIVPEKACESPPSSRTALKYLYDFCILNRVSGQCFAALAAILFIPYRGGKQELFLPEPQPNLYDRQQHHFTTGTKRRRLHAIPRSMDNFQTEQSELLPYYMSLSCNIKGIRALLHGSFFDSSVCCNLVSPWLEGAFKTIDAIVGRGEYSRLAAVMEKRQPRLAALWLGAIIIGMEDDIFRPVRTGMFAIDLLAAAWTATTHSFIGPGSLVPSLREGNKISRSDECRLLYLADCEEHSRVPMCPWQPFGNTSLSDTDISVREHASCQGHHRLQYEGWRWVLKNDRFSAADKGFSANGSCVDISEIRGKPQLAASESQFTNEQLFKPETLSASATRSIFSWLRTTGYPSNERGIRTHSWIDLEYDEDDDEMGETSESLSTLAEKQTGAVASAENVERWLKGNFITSRNLVI
jgi:hypothetical protein